MPTLLQRLLGQDKPAPAVAPVVPTTPVNPADGSMQPNPNAPAAATTAFTTAAATTPVAPAAPLDSFTALFDTATKIPEATKPAYQLNLEGLKATAGKLNFSGAMTPERATAIAAGGEGAVAAITEMMNQVGQAAFAAAAMQSGNMVNEGLTSHGETIQSRIPSLINSEASANLLYSNHPEYSHPAIKPQVENLRKRLEAQYPGSSPQEIVEAVKYYQDNLVSSLTPKPTPAEMAKSAGTNWAEFGNDAFGLY